MRVSFDEMYSEIKRVFMKYGMEEERAALCARIHTESNRDGIFSHGTNRVERFVDYIQKGWVNPNAQPVVEKDLGAIRILNGNMGPGISNAITAVEMGMELAKRNGIGMVGLRNTTHWMRGGSYGLYAANKGFAAILWTNTESCMPPWGGKTCTIGNNPFIMALPCEPDAVVLDMAMSQYAYGKLEVTRQAGKRLPFPGGFNTKGELTDIPGEIEESRRILPMGYWKGSSFAVMLDILGAALTGGIGAADIDRKNMGSCAGASQVFIIIDPSQIIDYNTMVEITKKEINHIKSAELAENAKSILAPGEDYVNFRKDHDRNGIFVDDEVWKTILAL